MKEKELFTKSRRELVALAKELGVTGLPRMTKLQLIHAITIAQSMQEKGPIWIPRRQLAFKRFGQTRRMMLHNQTDRSLKLGLEVVDRNRAFTIPSKAKEVVLKGKDVLSVPLRFEARRIGSVITKSKVYRARIRVWDLESNRVVGYITLSGVGPGYVPFEETSCIIHPAPHTAPRAGNSPPDVSLSVEPQLVWPGETVHVSWSATGADWVAEEIGRFDSEVLREGEPWGEDWHGSPATAHSADYDTVISETTMFGIFAGNEDGTSYAPIETVWIKIPVGYHDASMPGGGVYESELNLIREYLEEIESRLTAGCIQDNTNLDRFGDPYLRDGLTDDILTAMRNVVVITRGDKLPTAYRDTSDLCDPAFGVIPSDRSFVGICREMGADDLTLLHELYHYSADHDHESEERAFAISNCDPITHIAGCYLTDTICAP